MIDALAGLAVLTGTLRTLLLAGGIVLAAAATADWAVRTRRISPFSGVARFMRGRVEPRLAGIERQVARAGGNPASTPWWGLVLYVVCAALLLAALDMASALVREAFLASAMGGAGVLFLAVRWTFAFLRFALLVRVLGSWFPRLTASRWLGWSYGATEWILRPLRRLIPSFGVVDVTPIVAYFALQIAQWLVERVLFAGLR
jgi:YggT family protein